jgi:hypothetical protein
VFLKQLTAESNIFPLLAFIEADNTWNPYLVANEVGAIAAGEDFDG